MAPCGQQGWRSKGSLSLESQPHGLSVSPYNLDYFISDKRRVFCMRPQTHSVIAPTRLLAILPLLIVSLPLWLGSSTVSAEEDSAHLQARKKTAPYYQDAQICRSRSKADPLPDGADPATTIDPSKYLTCINQMGYHQEANTDPLLVALHRCHDQKIKSASASGETSFRAPSQAQVRACLSARGFPSAGTPPNPNAPAVLHQNHRAMISGSTPKTPPTDALSPAMKSPSVNTENSQIETVIIPPRNPVR